MIKGNDEKEKQDNEKSKYMKISSPEMSAEDMFCKKSYEFITTNKKYLTF